MKKILLTSVSLSLCASMIARDPSVVLRTDKSLEKKTFEKVSIQQAEPGGSMGPNSNGVIKMNVIPLFIGCLNFQGEYGFHKNMSGALGFHYLLPVKLPDMFTPSSPETEGETFNSTSFSGWGITPEFRFYPGKKVERVAPHGFYIGAYLRYAMYTLKADYLWKDANSNTLQYNLDVTYGGITGGLLIGSQWLIGKHFSIDWWILGGGRGNAKMVFNASSPNLNLTPQEQAELKEDIRENFDGLKLIGGTPPQVEVTSNSARATVGGLPMISYRWGLCLGYAF